MICGTPGKATSKTPQEVAAEKAEDAEMKRTGNKVPELKSTNAQTTPAPPSKGAQDPDAVVPTTAPPGPPLFKFRYPGLVNTPIQKGSMFFGGVFV